MPLFQPPLPPLPSSLSFSGKTIAITGASAGLGLAAAQILVLHGAREVIFAVRSAQKGEAAKTRILSMPEVKTANPMAIITVMHLDLEDYSSVLNFSDEIKTKYPTLDMLLLNAGFGSLQFELTTTGHEKMIQVNLLSSALLALELLPLLEKTSSVKGTPSRLTWVGSFVQFQHGLTSRPVSPSSGMLGHFSSPSNFIPGARYPDSKFLGTLFVRRLAKSVDRKKVVVNEVSPGMVKTGFGDYPLWMRAMFGVILFVRARSPAEGAGTYAHALGVVGSESHGKYLSDGKISK